MITPYTNYLYLSLKSEQKETFTIDIFLMAITRMEPFFLLLLYVCILILTLLMEASF